jgi:hypothetical protein
MATRRYNIRPMDHANNAEYEALQRNAQELRKELGLDKPPDRLDLLRTEVDMLNGLKGLRNLRKHDEVREPRDAECEAMEARIKELQKELGLDQPDRRSFLASRLKNLESLKEMRDELQRKQG